LRVIRDADDGDIALNAHTLVLFAVMKICRRTHRAELRRAIPNAYERL
jgi:hypothetical protein